MIRTTSGFSLAHVLSDIIEGEGFMTYAEASPPGVKRDIWVSHYTRRDDNKLHLDISILNT